MPVNQPPISQDPIQSSWQYEVTELVNQLELQRNRATRGPDFPTAPTLGAEHYSTGSDKGWFKYDTTDGWIKIGG